MAPQPGDYVARKALPLLAVRLKAELDAAKRRIAELEGRPTKGRGPRASTAMQVAVATAGAIGLKTALTHRQEHRQQAERERILAEVEAEQQRHRAELAAERERAARCEAELRQQLTELTAGTEQAAASARAAAITISTLNLTTEVLRQKLSDEENQAWQMHFEVAGVRRELAEARAQSRRHHAAFLEAALQRHTLQLQLAGAQGQLGSELADWQAAYAQLAHNANEGQRQLDADNSHLRHQLAALESRAGIAEVALSTLQTEACAQERFYRERIEQIQRAAAQKKAAQPRNPLGETTRKRKRLPTKKKPKQLPAGPGIVDRIVMTAAGATGAVVGLGAGLLLGGSGRTGLPPKEVGTYFEVTPAEERKRLPPRR